MPRALERCRRFDDDFAGDVEQSRAMWAPPDAQARPSGRSSPQVGRPLALINVKHFERVPGLEVLAVS
jgi:hypothetical protein